MNALLVSKDNFEAPHEPKYPFPNRNLTGSENLLSFYISCFTEEVLQEKSIGKLVNSYFCQKWAF